MTYLFKSIEKGIKTDKVREWILFHITIPIEAILLLRDDYHNEFKESETAQ